MEVSGFVMKGAVKILQLLFYTNDSLSRSVIEKFADFWYSKIIIAGNSNLHASKADKSDEFYTQLSLVKNGLNHYKKDFESKTILCNCDEPYESKWN